MNENVEYSSYFQNLLPPLILLILLTSTLSLIKFNITLINNNLKILRQPFWCPRVKLVIFQACLFKGKLERIQKYNNILLVPRSGV